MQQGGEEAGRQLVEVVEKGDSGQAMTMIRDMSRRHSLINTQDQMGFTALIWAVVRNLPDVSSMLIAKGADVHIRNKNGSTALSSAASFGLCVVIAQLLRAGAVVDEQKGVNYGNTPLMQAAMKGHDEAVTLLLKEGADASLKNEYDRTAAELAWKDSTKIILRKYGATTEEQRNEKLGLDLIEAVESKKGYKVLRMIREIGDCNFSYDRRDKRGFTALIWAAVRNLPEVSAALIEKGADVHILNADGNAALSVAASYGHCDIMTQLLGAGAEIDVRNNLIHGNTPLMAAATMGNDAAVTLLLEEGADKSLKNEHGRSAADMAWNNTTIDLLKKFQSKKAEEKKKKSEEAAAQRAEARKLANARAARMSNTLYAWLMKEALAGKDDFVMSTYEQFNTKAACDSLDDVLENADIFDKVYLVKELNIPPGVANMLVKAIAEERAKKTVLNSPDAKQSYERSSSSGDGKSGSTSRENRKEGGGRIGGTREARTIPASAIAMGKRIGKGGFGDVHLAEHDHQQVAVKCFGDTAMTPKNMESICNEVNIMTQLKHPCLVELLGLVFDDREGCDEPPKLVMEYAPNGSLYSLLHGNRDISWPDRHRMAGELARGLAYLHKKKVVHRDIKSLNVVLGEHLNAKWCDFGLSCLKKHSVESKTSTVQGSGGSKDDSEVSVMGTFRWMSPELLNRLSDRCFESDIWAFGMLLYELASRDIPFANEPNEKVVQLWIKEGRGENVPKGCPSWFGDIMQDCWKERTQRPTAEKIVLTLKEADMSSTPSSFTTFVSPSASSSSCQASNENAGGKVFGSSSSNSGMMMKDSTMDSFSTASPLSMQRNSSSISSKSVNPNKCSICSTFFLTGQRKVQADDGFWKHEKCPRSSSSSKSASSSLASGSCVRSLFS